METNEFVSQLKAKYGYSDEMEQFLQKAISAIITYYGEDKKNIVFAALSECEIHIQKENENTEQYLNQYFGTNKKWDIPFLGGAFQHTELSVNNKIFLLMLCLLAAPVMRLLQYSVPWFKKQIALIKKIIGRM